MTQTLIEKLEALPEYVGVTGEVFANDYVLIRLNKWKQFIEQAKAEPQPTPQDVIDAERWRLYRKIRAEKDSPSMGYVLSEAAAHWTEKSIAYQNIEFGDIPEEILDRIIDECSVIDQAMKGE